MVKIQYVIVLQHYFMMHTDLIHLHLTPELFMILLVMLRFHMVMNRRSQEGQLLSVIRAYLQDLLQPDRDL